MNGEVRALLVDPSLFTAPYDAALTEGLVAAEVHPTWAVRPVRAGDEPEIPERYVDAFFYRRTDRLSVPGPLRALMKGVSHAKGLAALLVRVARSRPDVVHFQWAVVPALDALAIALIRRWCPVVLTVHDTTPFNGEHLSFLQNLAFDLPIKLSDRAIVHTESGRKTLIRRGIAKEKIAVVPHGALRLRAAPSRDRTRTDDRFTFVSFGEMKPYKGIDVLIEAIGGLPKPLREKARFVVAGRPRMDLLPIRTRIQALGLGDCVELRAGRLSDQELADLFAEADAFVFPYRQIDASGAYFLVRSLGKWMIASHVGVFAETLRDGQEGTLVPPEDPAALAAAIATAVRERKTQTDPRSAESDWLAIGQRTRELYRDVAARFAVPRAARAKASPLPSEP